MFCNECKRENSLPMFNACLTCQKQCIEILGDYTVRWYYNNTNPSDSKNIGFDSCQCGTHNPIGQGHSLWCQMFKSEF